MKNIIKVVLFVLIINFSLNHLLVSLVDKTNYELFYSLKICQKIVMILISFYLISKIKLNLRSYKENIITIVITLVIFYFSYNYVSTKIIETNLDVSWFNNLLFFISCLCVAIFEELFFRVYVFERIYKSKKKIILSIVLTSVIFGCAHFSNMLKADVEQLSIIIQVISAVGIGLIFQTILIRVKSILFVITLHAIINYLGMYKSKLIENQNISKNIDSYTISEFISSLMFTLIFIGISLSISYILIKKVKYKSKIIGL
ncbi:CPBP family intramembrane glutamic endopeptidase [Lacinutrix himadriensis]|uniref:CPBP family intramembrane glutamic endopeptidase n=1 Tax=Lacinutrix himadriensis TaxID=641549 RepID=UPI0006E2F89E|nr:CPBP family intramembrane glutamic endopeptidase [Lacinutrix himadriensis]